MIFYPQVTQQIGGNTSGTTANISSGTMVLAGGNNITLSQNGNSVTISAGTAGGGGGNNTGGMSNLGNTSGTTGVISGSAIQLLFAGGNNITLSQSLNGSSATITISAPNQTVQPIGSGSFGMSNIGNTSGTTGVATGTSPLFVLAGGNNITLSQSLNGASATITISAFNSAAQTVESQSFGMSNLGNTSGTTGIASGGQIRYLFAGGNNITLSQSINGASGTVTISAFNQTVESQSFGMSNLGNTSGTTGIASGGQMAMFLAGGNNITLSQSVNGASATVTISAFNSAAQTVESQSFGMSNIGNTSGTTGIASGGQVRFVFAGGNNVTLSQSINGASGTITVSAFNQTVGSQTFGMSNLGNTSGTTGIASGAQMAMFLAGGNNITLSQSVNGASATVTISAFNSAAQTVESQSLGMSNIGNTSGTTGIASGGQVRFVFAGGNNITLSQSINGASGTITVSAFNQTVGSQTFGMSNLGNTAGTTGVASGAQLGMFLAATGLHRLSQSVNGASATVTIDNIVTSYLHWPDGVFSVEGNYNNGFGIMSPLNLRQNISASQVAIWNSISIQTSSNNTMQGTLSLSIGIYSLNGSTFSLGTSGSQSFGWTQTDAGSTTSYNGFRRLTVPLTMAATPGDWFYVVHMRTSNGGTSEGTIGISHIGGAGFGNQITGGDWGKTLNGTVPLVFGLGQINSSVSFTSAMPSSIASNAMNYSGNMRWPGIYIQQYITF